MKLAPAHRRVLLFLATVLVPGVVLLAATFRLVRQEGELAVQRRAETQALMVTQLGQELELRLERLRARAANGTDTVRSPAIVLIGRVIANRLELPWEAARPTPVREPQVAALLESGNQAEFADQRFAEAATLYARAARIASDAATRAEASLMAARVSVRAGDTASALARYRDLIEVPLSLRDDDGVPYPVYAADALARWPASASLAVRSLQQAMLTADLPPTAIYAVRDVSARLVAQADGTLRDSAEALARKTEEKLRATERTLALQREFPALRTFAERAPARTNAAALWIPFSADTASEPWLVSVPLAAAAGADTGVVVVARAAPILAEIAADGSPVAAAARAARITANEPAGQPLGDAFPGVRVHFPGGLPGADARRFGESFLLFALPLVLGIMLFSAYLLWRDVRREVASAALRSQFVSSVSHELKTPLTSIRMFAELLRAGSVPGQTRREYLEIMVNESERLTRLINNVLDFSRIEAGGRSYRHEDTSLADVVHNAARTMAYPLAQDGFELNLDVDRTVPSVRADGDAITQAVLNLLSNAMKFSGQSRTIDLRLARENGSAVIRVADRGRGIASDEQHMIFDKYYRSAAAETDGIPGTGLGLALVAHVAAGHGGRVEVESEPGRGSTFSLVLPLERA